VKKMHYLLQILNTVMQKKMLVLLNISVFKSNISLYDIIAF